MHGKTGQGVLGAAAESGGRGASEAVKGQEQVSVWRKGSRKTGRQRKAKGSGRQPMNGV